VEKDSKVTDAWKGLSMSWTLQINSFHITDERLLSTFPKTHTHTHTHKHTHTQTIPGNAYRKTD